MVAGAEPGAPPLLCTAGFRTVISVVRYQPSVGPGSATFAGAETAASPLILWSALPRADWDPRSWRAWVNAPVCVPSPPPLAAPNVAADAADAASDAANTAAAGGPASVAAVDSSSPAADSVAGVPKAVVVVDTTTVLHAHEVRQRVLSPYLLNSVTTAGEEALPFVIIAELDHATEALAAGWHSELCNYGQRGGGNGDGGSAPKPPRLWRVRATQEPLGGAPLSSEQVAAGSSDSKRGPPLQWAFAEQATARLRFVPAVEAVVEAGRGVLICAAFCTNSALAAARAWCTHVIAAAASPRDDGRLPAAASCDEHGDKGSSGKGGQRLVKLQLVIKLRLGGRAMSEHRVHRAKEQLTRALLRPRDKSSGGKRAEGTFSQVTILHLLSDKENERTLSVMWSNETAR